jgi:undecaprenyl-diphosphatase
MHNPMNPLFAAIILGAVQGVTEFLPVSSTAHLAAIPVIFGWTSPLLQSQAFDAVLHLGTLAALLVVFGREWGRLLAGLPTPGSPNGRMVWGIALATIPALAAGFLLEHKVAEHLRSPSAIAGFLAAGAAILWAADSRRPGGRTAASLGFGDALLIGCAQAFAILPGLSRSGMTIAAGLALGLSRAEAARYAFLLSAPVIAAAGLWESRHLAGVDPGNAALLAAGIAVAALTGAMAIRWFLRVVSRIGLMPFVVYRFVLSVVLLAR